jgi:hypothetical protein
MTDLTRAQHDALTRRRILAVDKALAAMVTTIQAELPGDHAMLEGFRTLASRTRQQLLANFPKCADEIGRDG